MTPSRAIRFISYDVDSSRLSITFIGGRRSIYENVPEDVYEAFINAPARGQFFNFAIRDRYEFHEVKRSA